MTIKNSVWWYNYIISHAITFTIQQLFDIMQVFQSNFVQNLYYKFSRKENFPNAISSSSKISTAHIKEYCISFICHKALRSSFSTAAYVTNCVWQFLQAKETGALFLKYLAEHFITRLWAIQVWQFLESISLEHAFVHQMGDPTNES